MNIKYQMWLTGNAEAEKLRFPVLPEKITVSIGSKNTSVDVSELGEIVIKQARPAYKYSFESFFPAAKFPGLPSGTAEPQAYVERIQRWLDSKRPVHLIITNPTINVYCTIESFTYYEKGGDPGTIYYSISFKEYREVSVRPVSVQPTTQIACIIGAATRVDNSVNPRTYIVVYGDCLWNIAKRFYGDGSKYTYIRDANASLIASHNNGPNAINVGDVLTIPEV